VSRIMTISICLALWAASAAAVESCPIYETRAWHAWIDNAGENGSNRLIVFGQVDLPSPGFIVDWEAGPMDRMNPPSWRVRLRATPPNGAVAQVIMPTDLTMILPTDISRFRSIVILCGDRSLVEISDVIPRD